MNEERKTQRSLKVSVISDKMDRTATVLVERRVRHPVYGKYIRRSTKLHVHDPENTCRAGDMITIEECRPISKTKSWRLVGVVKRAH